ncbi:MAG: hypothetical protein JWN78_117 [Bacteroidota bacterium]|nr:hypothetical protein [Bacteroidota bacterium]
MKKNYRKGAVGALMDEYERAVEELKSLLNTIPLEEYSEIKDLDTIDPDCKSVQTIMNHVVRAGYGYCNYIRKQFGDPFTERKEFYDVETPQSACTHLDEMLVYTEETLQNKYDITFDDILKNIIKTNWGQHYDFDQLMEHAIVHILRHRRQIEKFMVKA